MDVNKIYAAEEKVFEDEQELTEIGVKKFFCHITGDPWFINKYGEGYKIYIIGDFFDHSFAYHKDIYILYPQHFTESAVCHEISHSCKKVRSNPHGKAWMGRYVELVKRYISQDKGEELEKAFKELFTLDK